MLDGGWSVEAVAPSRTALLAYEIDLQLVEPRGGSHTLTATPPEGAPVQTSFDVLGDPRFVPSKGRGLVIGNSAYEHRPRLPGVIKDVVAVRAFLESGEGWHLAADRVESRTDLESQGSEGDVFRSTIANFFGSAAPDETLFFYFSGHGESDAMQGYLLPIDVPANDRKGRSPQKICGR